MNTSYYNKSNWVRTWILWYSLWGFTFPILVEGTEEEMRRYMDNEFNGNYRYSACSDSEIKLWKSLGMKIYVAPEIKDWKQYI